MSDFLEVIPLGGIGEFGMNCAALRTSSDFLLVDAGMGFPRGERGADLGVQVIVPETSFIRQNQDKLRGIILTHGHEDHVGAVSFFIDEFSVPVYGSRLTLGLVAERLRERNLLKKAELIEIEGRQKLDFGSLKVEPLYVTHSYPDSFCLAIDSPAGRIIWTGDFKFDQTPIDGRRSDLHRLAAFGDEGVLALFSDSTNSTAQGLAPSESSILEPLRSIFRMAKGRIIGSTFASSIHRIQVFADLAQEFGRSIAPVGRSMLNNIGIATRLGYLHAPESVFINISEINDYPPDQVLLLASGSQGEPRSALSRLAVDQFKKVSVQQGDVVILSTRIIPGNEKSITSMVNHFYRRGAQVFDANHSRVHASGHGYQEDLKLMISLTRPRFFTPIHGEFRQLKAHTWIAAQQGISEDRIKLIETGDCLRLKAESAEVTEKVQVGRRFIDDGILEEVHEMVLRERRFLSEDGFVMVILRLDRLNGSLIGEPEIVSRGFVLMEESTDLVNLAQSRIAEVVEETSLEEKQDEDLFDDILRKELRRLFRRKTGKRPLIVSLTIEI